ncbi:hypothetical protein MMC09_007093 [Bachmanniomyces sp. S44760]|nr:hypothetical protein [Bachmanniomyces sp. S44760]
MRVFSLIATSIFLVSTFVCASPTPNSEKRAAPLHKELIKRLLADLSKDVNNDYRDGEVITLERGEFSIIAAVQEIFLMVENQGGKISIGSEQFKTDLGIYSKDDIDLNEVFRFRSEEHKNIRIFFIDKDLVPIQLHTQALNALREDKKAEEAKPEEHSGRE